MMENRGMLARAVAWIGVAFAALAVRSFALQAPLSAIEAAPPDGCEIVVVLRGMQRRTAVIAAERRRDSLVNPATPEEHARLQAAIRRDD